MNTMRPSRSRTRCCVRVSAFGLNRKSDRRPVAQRGEEVDGWESTRPNGVRYGKANAPLGSTANRPPDGRDDKQ